jgi:haloacetate dehalogenase
MAYGGGNWVDFLTSTGSSINTSATTLFNAGNAFETYHTFFDQLSVTNASIFDYQAGATVDYEEEVADQAAGRKVKMPMHVEYSYYNLVQLGGFDVQGIWGD